MGLRIIGGSFKGIPLKSPKSLATRPTSGALREAVFDILRNEIEGATFLDLFAGSGAMGLEAISRGAKRVVFVEKSKIAASCIHENIKRLQVEEKGKVFCKPVQPALKQLQKAQEAFDIIYLDPPYDIPRNIIIQTLQQIDELSLLKKKGQLFLEDSDATKEYQNGWSCLKTRKFGKSYLRQYALSRYIQVT